MTNPFTWVFLAALAAATAVRFWLARRQIRHVRAHRDAVPASFADSIPLSAHQKAADYTVAKMRLSSLDRLACGPAMGHRRVTGNSSRQPGQGSNVPADGKFLDTLVDISQSLLEIQHRLSHRLKTKMSRFDDPGMYRSNGNLNNTCAPCRNERILVIGRCHPCSRIHTPGRAQRIVIGTPGKVARPTTIVGGALEIYAEQIMRVPLRTIRRGINARLGWQAVFAR